MTSTMGAADRHPPPCATQDENAMTDGVGRHWTGCAFDGGWIETAGGRTPVIEPATGETLYEVGLANADDVARAAAAARAAQVDWAAANPGDRSAIFHRAAGWLEDRSEALLRMIVRETGSIPPKAGVELREAVTMLRMAGSVALEPTGWVLASPPGRTSLAKRLPVGVVGVISPFNFPLILSMRAAAPALAVGNAVIIKPDVQTPFAGGFLIALALEAAGLPAGLLHVLPGGRDAGEALVIEPRVRMIAFTGSTAVGRRVGELAGRHLKKVSLELGGKNALIVLEDADLALAAGCVAWGAWLHQGQICMSAGRILVHERVGEALVRLIAAKAERLSVGDPATQEVALGPLINAAQVAHCHGIVQDSIAAGAVLEAGGSHDERYFRPTVLSAVAPGMRAFDEEIFGPVASVTTFASDDEAVTLANDTDYGLAAAVISPSLSRARALGERLHTGLLHINDQTVNDETINPFGGRGCSGNGASAGAPSWWDQFTEWQWMTIRDEPPQYPF
jgi:benzaldehyde dehydrogenase (NAD)